MKSIKIQLNENDIPRQWYNLAADLPPPWLRLLVETSRKLKSVSLSN